MRFKKTLTTITKKRGKDIEKKRSKNKFSQSKKEKRMVVEFETERNKDDTRKKSNGILFKHMHFPQFQKALSWKLY